MSMFNLFGPTPEEKQVAEATDPENRDDDWKAYLSISDDIRIAQDGGKKILKAILKRTRNKNSKAATFALNLLGSCVSNDDIGRFHDVVATDETLNAIIKLGRSAKSIDVRDKALLLIRKWAEAFGKVGQYRIFHSKYHALKKMGVVFPDSDNAPVLTPQASHDTNPYAAQTNNAEETKIAFSSSTPQYTFKLKNDLVALLEYLNTCRGLLKPIAIQYKGRKAESHHLLIQMTKPLLQIQARLNTLIVSLDSEELMDLTIKLGEEVYQTVEWLNAIEQGREMKELPSVPLPKRLQKFLKGDDTREGKGRMKGDVKTDGKANDHDADDPFAQIARRRLEERKGKQRKEAEIKQVDVLGIGDGAAATGIPGGPEPTLDELFAGAHASTGGSSSGPAPGPGAQISEEELNAVLDLSDIPIKNSTDHLP